MDIMDILPLTVNNIDYLFTKLSRNSYNTAILKKIMNYRMDSINSYMKAVNSRDTAFFSLIDKNSVYGLCLLRKLSNAPVPIIASKLEEETTWIIINLRVSNKITEKQQLKFLDGIITSLKVRSASKILIFLSKSKEKHGYSSETLIKSNFEHYESLNHIDVYKRDLDNSIKSTLHIIKDFKLSEKNEDRIDIIPGIDFNDNEILTKSVNLTNLIKKYNLPYYFHISNREFFIRTGYWPGIYLKNKIVYNFVET